MGRAGAGNQMAEPGALVADDMRRAAAGDRASLAAVTAALKAKASAKELAATAAELTPPEAARLILRLKPKRARALYDLLGDMPSLATLQQLDPGIRPALLGAEERTRLAAILARLDPETVADFLYGAPRRLVELILAGHPEADRIRAALPGSGETAAAVMRRNVVSLPETFTVAETIEAIRRQAAAIEKLDMIYVVDAAGHLIGYLKPRHLLLHAADTRLAEAMRRDPVQVAADASRAEVLKVAETRRLPTIPVTDTNGRLVGAVTIDELRAIARAEAAEDIALMSGIDPESTPMDGPLRIVPHRLP